MANRLPLVTGLKTHQQTQQQNQRGSLLLPPFVWEPPIYIQPHRRAPPQMCATQRAIRERRAARCTAHWFPGMGENNNFRQCVPTLASLMATNLPSETTPTPPPVPPSQTHHPNNDAQQSATSQDLCSIPFPFECRTLMERQKDDSKTTYSRSAPHYRRACPIRRSHCKTASEQSSARCEVPGALRRALAHTCTLAPVAVT